MPRWNPGIQNGNRLVGVLYSDYYSNSGLMLKKYLKYSEEIAQRAISSRFNDFVFYVLFVLGLFIIFMKEFPLDMLWVIGLHLEFFSFSIVRGDEL
jgi:hypothetical protein